MTAPNAEARLIVDGKPYGEPQAVSVDCIVVSDDSVRIHVVKGCAWANVKAEGVFAVEVWSLIPRCRILRRSYGFVPYGATVMLQDTKP